MAEFKPTFLIVPGAWHPSSCYKTLAAHLKAAQFPVLIATHPSLNSAEPSTATTTQDAQAVREILLPLIDDQGKNIVLLTHSYGGVSGSAAAYGLSTASRAKAGKKGGILGIACIAAWRVPEGERLVDMLGGSDPPWLLRDQPSPGLGQIASPIDVF
ncbi:hypothetical protein LCER1_G006877 [Lachnellula cervina]|uniref:AB hydrolase-1 domain-containing protein n=1 Tax=Lachnellula cervina TaxID=1316786 RepID=A0A7D8YYE4_9HELO|nr:hypothetical protein LCER1_G006877 [Lachnellula cervina]